jgi:hypothetical protein
MVRPRYSDASTDAIKMLEKAHFLLEKAEKLHMVEHDGKKVPHFAADGKGHKDEKKKADMAEKDKYCMKRFGKKYSECTAEQKAECDKNVDKVEKGSEKCPECGGAIEKGQCMKTGCPGMMKYGNVQKGPHHKAQSFDTKPGNVQFMAESGGQTYNAYYTTNQSLLESDDVANKGARSENYSLEALGPITNTHDRAVVTHEITSGGETRVPDEPIQKARMAPCAVCGANPMQGDRICALPGTPPHPIEGCNDYRPMQ